MERRLQINEIEDGQIKGNELNTWALIYDQCSLELKNKLKGTQGYDTAKSANDMAKLLTMILGFLC